MGRKIQHHLVGKIDHKLKVIFFWNTVFVTSHCGDETPDKKQERKDLFLLQV